MKKKISIVIAVFNEENIIKTLYERIGKVFSELNAYDYEIIFKLMIKYALAYEGNYAKIYIREKMTPYYLIVEDDGTNSMRIRDVVLNGFDSDKHYEVKIELHVKSNLAWDSRIESIRFYQADMEIPAFFSYDVSDYFEVN